MTGPVAQIVALACHFNSYARGGPPEPFFLSNSTCEFCEFVYFMRRKGGVLGFGGEIAVCADTPDVWLAAEVRTERRAIITREPTNDPRLSDRMSAGFVGGGGTWKLLIVSGDRSDAWTARWSVGDRKRSDRRIWRVTYGLVRAGRPAPEAPALDAVAAELRSALEETLAFSLQHNLDGFSAMFDKAMQCLSSSDPFSLVYHKDLAPAGLLELYVQQLLAACQAAWVFGGMGSWNDLGFEGDEQKQYCSLSDRLFRAVNDAISAATNTTAKP